MREHHEGIGAHTRLVALLGHPVGHSLSPRIHNAAFRAQGLDMAYVAFDVHPERLGSAVEGLRGLGLRGANVTVPHKEAVVRLMDEVDVLARQVGAVNTIVNDDGRLCGYNTDVEGFAAALRSVLPGGAQGETCVLIGAGGAARAVVTALVQGGAQAVWIHNRTTERAEALCAHAAEWGSTICEAISHARLREALRSARVIVNATPVGLAGAFKNSPVPVDTVLSDQVVVDLAYGAQATRLVETARENGAVAIDGREMLLMQAAGSYRLWTGLDAPIGAMRESIDQGER